MNNEHLLVINSGSSSIKFALYEFNRELKKSLSGFVENIKTEPTLKLFDAENKLIKQQSFSKNLNYDYYFGLLIAAFESNQFNYSISAVGHRIVHGGSIYNSPILITPNIIEDLKKLIPFAPLHQPYNLMAAENIVTNYPQLPQVACFDTAFHSTHPPVADRFGLPNYLYEAGVRRYGFHGLSYEYIMHTIKNNNRENDKKKIVVAHLGNGASMCAIANGKSVDSTMGFTALDGLVMGTRCGALDPGVILYLIHYKNMSCQEIENMLYKDSGLLGVSTISSNMKQLLESPSELAKDAIELFIYRIRRELGAFVAVLNGLDMLVFTGGIGEHAWQIRQKICDDNAWLGLKIDMDLNRKSNSIISDKGSKIEVHVIPTNEEWVIANHTYHLIQGTNHGK